MFSPKTLRVYGLKGFFMVLAAVSCFGALNGPADAATLQVPSTQYPTIQSAINAANLGDTIVVQAGRTYTENLVLRHKSTGSGWITIQSSNLHLLPAEGNRVSPADAVNMPRIQTSSGSGSTVFSTQSGSTPSHHYKLVGLEIARASSLTGQLSALIELGTQGSSQDTLAEVPHNFVIDRCYVHGEDGRNTRRGLSLNARQVEIVNSYFSKFHEPGADSQAILGWNTPGEIIIRNNYLEAASENVMFGGADIDLPTVITNILIEGNYFFKPMSWKGQGLGVKNLLEFKNGTQIIVRNNIFENVWAEAQTGWAIVMTPRDENEVAKVDNITFEYNIIRNAGNGFQMLTDNDYSLTPSLKNINIKNNLVLLSGTSQGGQGNIVILVPGMNPSAKDIIFNHNTFVTGGSWEYRSFAMDGSNLVENLVFDNNIFAASSGTVWGVTGSGYPGTEGLNRAARSWTFNKNVLQRSSAGYPATSTYVANLSSFGFQNPNEHDYELKTSSPYKGAATDGKDIGADIAGLNEKTACVESGKQSDCSGVRRVSFSNYDFDGDGRADIGVFRPSSSIWYLNKSSEGFGGMNWGSPNDHIAPADYDGDGKTDIAVFRAESNRWYILKSSTMTYDVVYFGIGEDIPVQADYDGDGKADVAVWRPSTGVWYKLNSSNGEFTGYHFGLATDRPAVGDYDGDGISDYAVFRPSSGMWYIQRSTEGFYAVRFGLPTDKITPADFDGDGKTDIAVFRASTGIWYRLEPGSATNFSAFRFGISEDIPSPADFDGDGKADIAVFRPSTGVWYLQKSTEGFNAMNFGMRGDVPISAAFSR
ncbi:MAG: VCBS repeat-containing protein [Acidobacteria bacterium]|nr:VCBS repeat-containing protein [Acidobacteriota bacterium]